MPDDLLGFDIVDTGIELADTGPLVPDRTSQESLVGQAIDEAIQWRESNLERDQARATKFYMGDPFGDEHTGRSQIVMTVVRDVVHQMLPSILRIVVGGDKVVQFKPKGPGDEPIAEQQTEYINYIFWEDNDGFTEIRNTLLDGMIRKIGAVKWWWEEDQQITRSQHWVPNLESVVLLSESGEIADVVEEEDGTFSVTLDRTTDEGRARFMAIPNEEFVYSPNARTLEDAIMVAHVREVRADELIKMGVDPDVVMSSRGTSQITDDDLARERRQDRGSHLPFEDAQEEATRMVPVAEAYMYLTLDGDEDDGEAPTALHKCFMIGGQSAWRFGFPSEIVDERPFAKWTPFPEPHTMEGQSVADLTMDLQRLDSQLWRGILDSLAGHLDPATEVVEHQVNMADVLNQERGRVIRVRQPGMMREVSTEFVGSAAIPVLDMSSDVRAQRTGQTKASAGLDADALQSSTKAAVAATLSAAQQQQEMVTRQFVENLMAPLFRGLNRLVTQYQDSERLIRLRGEWVPVDPRHWDSNMDVTVNVALGAGTPDEQVQRLLLVAEKQEAHMAQGSPLFDVANLRATYERVFNLLGVSDVDAIMQTQQQIMQAQQAAAQQPPEPTPEQLLFQVEMKKIEQSTQEATMDAALTARDQDIKLLVEQMRAGGKSDEAEIKAVLESNKLDLEREKAELDAVIQGVQSNAGP